MTAVPRATNVLAVAFERRVAPRAPAFAAAFRESEGMAAALRLDGTRGDSVPAR